MDVQHEAQGAPVIPGDESQPRVTSTARFTPALLGLVPALLAVTLVVAGVITRAARAPQGWDLTGLEQIPIASREHVQGPVRYAQTPPAGVTMPPCGRTVAHTRSLWRLRRPCTRWSTAPCG